jgi:hypothetical protein
LFLKTGSLRIVLSSILLATGSLAVPSQPADTAASVPGTATEICQTCIRDNLSYLAGPELRGRGSGTEDEHHAAQFIAGKLKQYGLLPAAENGEYIQPVTIASREVEGTPTVAAGGGASQGATVWAHGKDVAFLSLPEEEAAGSLQKLDLSDASVSPAAVREGAAVALKLKHGTTSDQVLAALTPFYTTKAAVLLVSATPELHRLFASTASHRPDVPKKLGSDAPVTHIPIVLVKESAFPHLWSLPEGAPVRVQARLTPWKETHTWNVLAKIPGDQPEQVLLLSAHLDHLGVVKGKVYPGADDDASGTVAVMELARALAQQPKPRRTIVAALWGSEEAGMVGSRYFLQHPTFPLQDIVANLEFEMIARPDANVKSNELWLTGWSKSDLGPELAAHGARLVADPHPAENFFTRSDNYALAQKGIVAQTVSSFGLHGDYHQPGDTLAKVDWKHLDAAIRSMIEPLYWLATSDFVPRWTTPLPAAQ